MAEHHAWQQTFSVINQPMIGWIVTDNPSGFGHRMAGAFESGRLRPDRSAAMPSPDRPYGLALGNQDNLADCFAVLQSPVRFGDLIEREAAVLYHRQPAARRSFEQPGQIRIHSGRG